MNWFRSAMRSVFAKPIGWLVKVKSVPANLEKGLGVDKSKPIVYLLQTASLTDSIALEKSTKHLGQTSPVKDLELGG